MIRAIQTRFAEAARHAPRVYWFVWWGTLVNRLGGFVVPLLTIYLTTIRGIAIKDAGAIVAGFGAGQIVASLVGGWATDHLGRRFTMLISLFGGAVVMMILGEVRELSHLALAVLALGFVGELYRPAVAAFVADVVPPAGRVHAYGLLYWAVNVGFAVAALLGGFLVETDFRILFFADAATMAAYGVIVAIAVPETRPPPAPVPVATTAATTATRPWWRDRVFVIFVGIVFLLALVPVQTNAMLSIHVVQQGLAPTAYGAIMAINGVLIIVLQPLITSAIAHRDPDRVLAVSALLYGVGMAAHGWAPNVVAHIACVIVWTLGEVLESPTRSAMVAAMAPVDQRGRYQGALVMTWGAAGFLGPRLGTQLAEDVGVHAPWLGCLAVGAFVALAFMLTRRARRARIGVS